MMRHHSPNNWERILFVAMSNPLDCVCESFKLKKISGMSGKGRNIDCGSVLSPRRQEK